MANNNDGQIVLGLDIPKTVSQINDDIKKLEKQLEQVKATGALDTDKTLKQLNAQIKSLQAQLKTIEIKATVDPKSIQKTGQQIGSQIKNATKGSSVASEILNASDLDKQGKTYILKVSNTIEATKKEIQSKLRNSGYFDIEIKGVEKANGQIKSVTVNATNAKGVLEQLNFERAKMQKGGKVTNALVQTDDVKVLGTLSSSIDKVHGNLSTLKTKWEEQGVLVGDFKTKVEQLENSLASVGSKGELNGLESQIKTLKAEASQIAEVNKIQLLSNGGIKNDYATQIAKLEGNFRSLGMVQDTINSKTQNVKNSLATLKAEFAKPVDQQNFQTIQTANDNLQKELIESTNEFERLKASMKGMATEQQRLSLANTIEAWNQKNTAATREVVDENHRYIMSLRDLNTQMTKMDFGKISTGFKQNENSMRAMNRLGKSLKEQFTQAYQSFTMWLSASSLVMKVISETREAFTELKEVNTLITEISKANENLNKQQLAKIADDGFDIASDYGKSVTHYLSGVQEASRAGYENAEAIAELSVAIQGAGDVTEDIANKYVIATDKAYGLKGSVEELTKVFDGSNYITNKNAVNMTELADGMSIVGSTAASFGIEVNETTAALGTMIASTQQSGSEMARAFRAILLNIRQVSDEEEGIDAEGLTKYEKACNALGVSLKETRNGVLQTRDAMDVLKELSVEYNKLEDGDLRRTQLLNSVGGKLRANALDALLKHQDMYSKMLAEYEQGTGSMAREAEKSANNWEGSLNRVKNTWYDTVENVANSDAIITVLNSFNGLLQVINKTTDALGSWGTIGLGAGLFAGFKNIGKEEIYSFKNCFEIADNNMCSLGY